jgi:hypothetical protein
MITNRKASIRRAASGVALTLLAVAGAMTPAKAGTLTQKDVQSSQRPLAFWSQNRAAATSSGVAFGSAFLLIAHTI